MQFLFGSFGARTLRIAAAGGLLALTTVAAQAATENLSTGLDASNTLITTSNAADGHWTVDQPLGGTAAARVMTASSGGWPGAWAPDGPFSSWVTIDADSIGNGSVIPYTYYRSFTLTAADLLTASISGTWGIDDAGDLKLNGTTISSSPADYSATTPFFVPTGSALFTVGVNLLTITMTSSDNFFEAVRLEGTLVPEPTTAMLMAFGALAIARLRRRA